MLKKDTCCYAMISLDIAESDSSVLSDDWWPAADILLIFLQHWLVITLISLLQNDSIQLLLTTSDQQINKDLLQAATISDFFFLFLRFIHNFENCHLLPPTVLMKCCCSCGVILYLYDHDQMFGVITIILAEYFRKGYYHWFIFNSHQYLHIKSEYFLH